jgi:DNA topoisomerase IA
VKNAQEAHEAIRPTDIRYLPCNMRCASFINILI